jgi:hypothetical protein
MTATKRWEMATFNVDDMKLGTLCSDEEQRLQKICNTERGETEKHSNNKHCCGSSPDVAQYTYTDDNENRSICAVLPISSMLRKLMFTDECSVSI